MNRRSIAMLAATVLVSSAVYAQTVLKGKVVDQDGKPIPGVTLTLKDGTATQTGQNGEFTINYKQAGTLSVSAIGYGRKEVNLTNQSTIQVTLTTDERSLDEVVVTAMGITREKKSLGYATQELKAAVLTDAGANSLTGALAGKAAGVQVNQFGGAIGSSARISIRETLLCRQINSR